MLLFRRMWRCMRMTASSIRTVTVGLGVSPMSALGHAACLPLATLTRPGASRVAGSWPAGFAFAKPASNYRQWGVPPRPETEFMLGIVGSRYAPRNGQKGQSVWVLDDLLEKRLNRWVLGLRISDEFCFLVWDNIEAI